MEIQHLYFSARVVKLLLEQEHGGRKEVKESQEKRYDEVSVSDFLRPYEL